MSQDVRVKICGLKTRDSVLAASEAGATYIGLNFFAKSPRYVTFDTARTLALAAPEGVAKVALSVDVDNAFLDQLTAEVPLDMLQLHGHESPERVTEVKARYGLPVMKVVGVSDASDLAQIDTYAKVADQLMVDAKPPKGADRPGGNAVSFDWSLIAGRRWTVPWMLAGGLTADNVAEAIAHTGAQQVDVSSGVESAPGVKDAARVRAFIQAVRCG